jgi:uncharacterized protein (TIGR00369 family)
MEAKTPADSEVIMTELVYPQHTNPHGSIFGGVVMSWIDVAAAIAAKRHSGKVCVTASVDELHFLRPIKQGDIVNIKARLTATFKSSCEVHVVVTSENPVLKENFKTTEALLTFVAIDSQGKASAMPPLKTLSDVEVKAQKEAVQRKEKREKIRRALMKEVVS